MDGFHGAVAPQPVKGAPRHAEHRRRFGGPEEARWWVLAPKAARRGHGTASGVNSFGMACSDDRSVMDHELLSTVMMFDPWNSWW